MKIYKKRLKRTPILILIVMLALIFALQYTTTFFSPEPGTGSPEKIVAPPAETITGKKI